MDAEEEQVSGPDLAGVRRGSRTLHGMAKSIFGFGLFTYGFITLVMLVLEALPGRLAFASTVTLTTDTTLGLLGVSATILIALVATLWARGQVADASLSRGRRKALTAVTTATGVGSVVVGAAGAAHRPAEGWNPQIALALLGLGVVLAYVAADVAFLMMEDRDLDEALRRHDVDDRRAKLWTARRNWLRQTRSASWPRPRPRRPTRARLRQTVVLLGWLVVVLIAALAALGGRRAITGSLGWWFLDVAVGVLVGQFAAHYFAITFIARRWEPFYWYCMFAILYLPLSALAQLELLTSMEDELPDGVPGVVGGLTFGVACCLVPLLLCLLGLTVSPRRWRRFRPMTQIRWSVISAIGREIELVDKAAVTDTDTDSPKRHSLVSRLMLAIRRANGTEEILPGDA